ncbi:MAG: hypothetical protein V3U24_10545 [Candidatus Neomarinimicrobiota bacterium]
MALELQQAGTFFRPGLIGRGLRLISGLVILFLISPLTALRPGGVISIGNIPLWIGLAFTLWLVNEVVNIGFGRDFGQWPRYGLVGLLVLSSLGDYLINGVWWAEIVTMIIATELLLVLGYLGISYVVASVLAVPG